MIYNFMKVLSVLVLTPILSILISVQAFAQSGPIEMDDSAPAVIKPPPPIRTSGKPVVGRRAAEKYMTPHEAVATGTNSDPSSSRQTPADHYLAVHIGGFVSDNAYNWGARDAQSNVGKLNLGVTYRVGEWAHSMDLAVRVDYANYSLEDGNAGKLSFLPMITFPDASSKFPLYLGAGVGLGVFTKQINRKSALALDYQLVLGARFFEVIGNTGFFIEAGLKNHLLLLSDGQFNGTFVAVGPVFTF